MASLRIEIRESVEINGNDYGSYNTVKIDNINEVSKRTLTIPSGSQQEIIGMSTSIGSGTFLEKDVRYIRMTNLTDNNPIILTFKNERDDEFNMSLDQGQSFIYSGISGSGVIDSFAASSSALPSISYPYTPSTLPLADLVNVRAISSGSQNSNLELFVASM